MSWKNVDLNLLIIFDALMSERNVTRAGQKIGLSQPAVSAALSKLRTSLKDELFIREAGGIRPTPRALELNVKFRGILSEIESALEDNVFDPQKKEYTVTLEMDFYSQLCLLPPLYAYIHSEAPKVHLRIKASLPDPRLDIEKFETDLMFTIDNVDASRYKVFEIYSDDYVVCTQNHFPNERLTMQELGSLPHLDIFSATPRPAELDPYFEAEGIYRKIKFRQLYPTVAIVLLKQGNLMCILPRRVAQLWKHSMGFNIYEMPFQPKPIRLKMVGTPSFNDCAFFKWFNEALQKINTNN